eukprot:gene20625-22660_t
MSAVKELQVQQKAVVAALSAERQRPSIKQQQPSSSSSPMQRQFICYFCNEPGHIARNCPRKPQFQRFGGQQRPVPHNRARCPLCEGFGHAASQCANNWIDDSNNRYLSRPTTGQSSSNIEQQQLLSVVDQSTAKILRLRKQIKKSSSKRRVRRFWERPGRVSTWWENFINDVVVPEE